MGLGAHSAVADNDRTEAEPGVDDTVDLRPERGLDPIHQPGVKRLVPPPVNQIGDVERVTEPSLSRTRLGVGRAEGVGHLITGEQLVPVDVGAPRTAVEQRSPGSRIEQVLQTEVGLRLRYYPERQEGTHCTGGAHCTTSRVAAVDVMS